LTGGAGVLPTLSDWRRWLHVLHRRSNMLLNGALSKSRAHRRLL
jgi:hypothetical protein